VQYSGAEKSIIRWSGFLIISGWSSPGGSKVNIEFPGNRKGNTKGGKKGCENNYEFTELENTKLMKSLPDDLKKKPIGPSTGVTPKMTHYRLYSDIRQCGKSWAISENC